MRHIYLTQILTAEKSPIKNKNARKLKKCQYIKKAYLLLKDGKIVEVLKSPKAFKTFVKNSPTWKKVAISDYSDKIIMPSFFDMHFHWVQDDVRMMKKDNLLTWLSKYTWPTEARFKSLSYSKKKAIEFKKALIKNGTLGGACYSAIYPHTVDHAMENFVGDFIVGNVLMDMQSPEYLTMSTRDSLKAVRELAKKYKKRYALTPRFAITTTPKLMRHGQKEIAPHHSFIQTHLSETQNEISFVLDLYRSQFKEFSDVQTYTDIYHRSNILGSKTIMGHGIYLSSEELKLLKKTKTSLCHCPTSNAPIEQLGLGSGLFPYKKVNRHGVAWALGSDIGGGPYLSMFDVMESFISQNKNPKLVSEAFYRATLAGAEILQLDRYCGSLEKGKWANFLVLDGSKFQATDSSKLIAKGKWNAESVLLEILKRVKKRSMYASLVEATFYRGRNLI